MSQFATRQAMLRARTRPEHQSLEAVPALARLLTDRVTLNDYATVLRVLHTCHRALAPQILACLPASSPVRALLDGQRVAGMEDDLAWLGVPTLPDKPVLPVLATYSHAMGALYVLEGSNLGGRVIARHLSDRLHVHRGAGASFFDGLTAETARDRWQILGTVLDAAEPEISDEALLDGARDTFRCLERQFCQLPLDLRQTCLTAAAAD